MIDGDVGVSPCILKTTDLDSITHGSRKPMRPFESPFLSKSDDEIRTWMKENKHPNFGELTFTILDEDFIGTGKVYNRKCIESGL